MRNRELPRHECHPLAWVKIHPQVRENLIRERVQAMVQSILEKGMLQPPIALASGDLVCGHYRVTAALELGWTEAMFLVYPTLDRREIIELQLVENLRRTDLSQQDVSRSCRTLLESGATQREIAAHLGEPEPNISRWMNPFKAGKAWEELFLSGQATWADCAVAVLADARERDELARLKKAGKLSAEKLRAALEAMRKPRSSRSSRPRARANTGGGARKPRLQWRLQSGHIVSVSGDSVSLAEAAKAVAEAARHLAEAISKGLDEKAFQVAMKSNMKGHGNVVA